MEDCQLNTNKQDSAIKNIHSEFDKIIGDPEKLWKYINESEDAEEVIKPIAWDLIGSTINSLRENGVSENLDVYEKCLLKIAEYAVPKEVYLGILEQFDPSIESKYVELLIPALSTVLKRISVENIEPCITVLETTFSTLSYFLESLNIPPYDDFDPTVNRIKIFEAQKIERFIEKYLTVLQPVIDEVCSKQKEISSDFKAFEGYTFQFLCSLLVMLGQIDLDDPQSNYQQSSENDRMSFKPSDICSNVLSMMSRFYSPNVLWYTVNWYKLLPSEDRSDESKIEVEKQVDRGRACYIFLLLCRGLLFEQYPKVYSNQCVLIYTCIPLNTLLSCQNQCVVWKGLEILSYFLNRTTESSISFSEVIYNIAKSYGNFQARTQSQNPIQDIFNNLINIAVMLPSKTVRMTAIQHVTKFLNLFYWEDKYSILVHLLRTTDHNGVKGVLIGFLKDRFNEILQDSPPLNSGIFFEAHKISTLGEMVFTLPQGPETDLLEDCDRLMPALNLLRFILIRDKWNKTGILGHLDRIDKNFLKPLRSGIDLSRAHYENELKKYDRKDSKNIQNDGTEFIVNGTSLPTLPYKDQKRTLEAALHTFDMIEIVAIRVIELIEVSHDKT